MRLPERYSPPVCVHLDIAGVCVVFASIHGYVQLFINGKVCHGAAAASVTVAAAATAATVATAANAAATATAAAAAPAATAAAAAVAAAAVS